MNKGRSSSLSDGIDLLGSLLVSQAYGLSLVRTASRARGGGGFSKVTN